MKAAICLAALAMTATPASANERSIRYAQTWADATYAPSCHVRVLVGGLEDPESSAEARPYRCEIRLSGRWASWGRTRLCAVMVHEYGHLAGHEHSNDPSSVMYPTAPRRAAPVCEWVHGMEKRERRFRERLVWARSNKRAGIRSKLRRISAAIGPAPGRRNRG